MEVHQTSLSEVLLLKPQIHLDSRGYFLESYRENFIRDKIGATQWVQENESLSTYGVLRGLHFQYPPYAQSKLVRVVMGSVLDVALDIRTESSTFGKYIAVELNDENKYQLYIPKGFAHGFLVLSSKAIFQYKVDAYYNRESEKSINPLDPNLRIDWKLSNKNLVLSEKDLKAKKLEESMDELKAINNQWEVNSI